MMHCKTHTIPILGLALFIGVFQSIRCEDEPQHASSSEEKSAGVPIIRQINKVNDDGTYTYGYEAADGSFKIETRDVLGNVKGMFGFIDESGELKRVSYTANNETGFRNSIVRVPFPGTPSGYSTVRPTSSEAPAGRKSVLLLKNSHSSGLHTTKGPVIQHIPKKPHTLKEDEEPNTSSSSSSSSSSSDTSQEYVGVNGRRFPVASNGTKNTSEERTDESAKSTPNPLRKVLVSKRPVEEKEMKGKGGNSLRRQLNRGLELRGEMAHIYSGGDNRLPPHLSALMSELRPIQVIRAAHGDVLGYQAVDPDGVPQDINEVSTTTTELPYGTRKLVQLSAPPGYISARYRARPVPVPVPEEGQYLQEVTPAPYSRSIGQGLQAQSLPLPVNVPFGGQGPPNYQMQPQYYDQAPFMIPAALRDELMAIIYNYLQVRLNPAAAAQNPYFSRVPYANPYLVNSLYNPTYPYANPNYSPVPYAVNPYLGGIPPYYPYANPGAVYPIPSQTSYSGPNVQFSPKQDVPRRAVHSRVPARAAAPADDADLLQMLLTSPTRVPISQLRYSPTTERIITAKSTQPVRNIQIITDSPESRPVTTETPEK